MAHTNALKVLPQTFALDDLTGQGLIIFETAKTRTKFSMYMGANTDFNLFLAESFKKEESGYSLSKTLLDDFGLVVSSGLIKEVSVDSDEVFLYFKTNSFGLVKKKVSLLELLGLWSVENFSIYAVKSLIEDCRQGKISLKGAEKPLKASMHKAYGQKYLM